jgi:hypothetical protein
MNKKSPLGSLSGLFYKKARQYSAQRRQKCEKPPPAQSAILSALWLVGAFLYN